MANAVRFLSADMIEKAKSGHPGMPLGIADVATMLFSKHIKCLPFFNQFETVILHIRELLRATPRTFSISNFDLWGR